MDKKHFNILIGTGAALTVALGASALVLLGTPKADYQYAAPQLREVRQIVKASGSIMPASSVDLSFERSGRIGSIAVKVGDTVKAGDILMSLDNAAEGAQLQQAQAMLNQRIAGVTQTQIDLAQASVDAAKADLDKTKSDATAMIEGAQTEVDSSQNNMKLVSGGDDSQIVGQAYESAVANLQASLPVLDGALQQADSVIGVDNAAANADFQLALSALDPSKLAIAKEAYLEAKASVAATQVSASGLLPDGPHDATDGAIVSVETSLNAVNKSLSAVSDVLNATISGTSLPQSQLTTMEATIQGTRSGITGELDAMVATKQGLDNAKNGLDAATIALNKAQQDLTNAQASANSLIALKQAAYEQAAANLADKTAPARAVDLAPLRAAVDEASVEYEKTVLRSPLSGIVSRQDGDVGGIVAPNAPLVSVIDATSLQLEVYVPETDVAKVVVGDTAEVTVDAFGTGTNFPASVIKIDPSSTSVNGQDGYKVTLQFTSQDDRLKAGMTANASIVTKDAASTLSVPDRSVIQRDDAYYVSVKGNGTQPVERQVQVGIKGSEGYWEITSGLDANDQVVTYGN